MHLIIQKVNNNPESEYILNIWSGRSALGQKLTFKCGEGADDGIFVSKIGEDSMISDSQEMFREKLMQVLDSSSGGWIIVSIETEHGDILCTSVDDIDEIQVISSHNISLNCSDQDVWMIVSDNYQ